MRLIQFTLLWMSLFTTLSNCKEDKPEVSDPLIQPSTFYFGSDLSYANQILDKGGVYKVNNTVKDPYQAFKDMGTTLVRFRLWHTPSWTKNVYDPAGPQMYNDLKDVEKGISKAKAEGMAVLLDIHYSDTWADPGKQEPPSAWKNITGNAILKDSIYQYTSKVINYLKSKSLQPDMVQIGNETNCGMMFSNAPAGFPVSNVCNNQWAASGEIYNSAIKAVRDISTDIKVILHVADPKNLDWWFGNMTSTGKVTDFDVIGFSYYPIWHTTIGLSQLSGTVKNLKTKYKKDLMILETAYPWTTDADDSYNNIFGGQSPVGGYPFSQQGQRDIMITIVKAMKDAGGMGVVYWEPGWITSNLKDQWGTGSSWENCTFFDYDGNAHAGSEYMKHEY
jgi:arabinogalactan endo-1,4-beta-galactosidase